MALSAEDARIRALRPAKVAVDPWRPLGTLVEAERRPPRRALERALTVFLAGAECPFTCVFCDLWRHTLDGATPAGALPAQLRAALAELPAGAPLPARIKLYNASNFFDARAVPPADLETIAALVEPFEAVTVECHPLLVGRRCRDFSRRVAGRLEVAVGLETVHPEAARRLNKKASLDDFDRAAGRLRAWDLDLRVFVLLGAPFVPPGEAVAWALRAARYALERAAVAVSLIPVRGGNGEMERLAAAGDFVPPGLVQLEAAQDGALAIGDGTGGVVTVDLWDAERLADCAACAPARLARLRRIDATGRGEPAPTCAVCGHGQ